MDIVIKGEMNPLTDLPEDMPVGRKIALNLALAAVADGKLDAIKTVIEHLDGKPAQSLNLGGQEDNPVGIDSTLTVTLVRPKESPEG